MQIVTLLFFFFFGGGGNIYIIVCNIMQIHNFASAVHFEYARNKIQGGSCHLAK